MTNHYTSDSHFNHVKICEYAGRPFSSVKMMNEELIYRWNQVVKVGDTVYHLGDFCFHPRSDIPAIRARLNGKIILVAGNHDNIEKQPEFYKTFDDVVGSDFVLDTANVWCDPSPIEYRLFLHHEPIPPSEWAGFADLHLCGHVHNSWGISPESWGIINVGVDACEGYRPMTLTEILSRNEIPTKPVGERSRDMGKDWVWAEKAGPSKLKK